MLSLWKWFQERLGWTSIQQTLLERKIPKPGRWAWAYTLGSATLVVFLIQVLTGMLLGMNYSPSPDHAYDSIRYIMTQVPLGGFLRGLHKWGATAMIVLMLLHLMRVYVMASYKRPRELTWIVGIFLLLASFGLGFTGYLLPWDQKAYWATAVGTNIAAQAPFLGEWIAKVLKGGEEMGALTLSRFYAFHVLILPTFLALLIGGHLFLVIYHGISAPPSPKGQPEGDYKKLKEEGKSFYPHSVFKDMVMAVLVIGVLFFLSIHFGADLEDPADPTDSTYNPRPEWYFLFLFQALKLFPGSLEAVAAVVLPTVLILVLILLPFLDRGEKRHPLARPFWMAGGMLAFGFIAYLSYQGWKSPLVNPTIEKNPFVLEGQRIYSQLHCAHCHSIRGEGGGVGPDLAIAVSKRSDEWLANHFRKPREVSPGSLMPELHLLEDEIQSLIAYLREKSGGGIPLQAMKVFEENCRSCHRLHGKGEEVGPDLSQVGNYRKAEWILRYLRDPRSVNPEAAMPGFETLLTKEDLEGLAHFLANQRGQ
ncbi:MAG: cytochrome b N-terminal domain-containing protein [Deltaproteobacteria bacterium]|nr:cytochrome b N-terminal domain-containing protein [Deltaproteobacteria bacterium]